MIITLIVYHGGTTSGNIDEINEGAMLERNRKRVTEEELHQASYEKVLPKEY